MEGSGHKSVCNNFPRESENIKNLFSKNYILNEV